MYIDKKPSDCAQIYCPIYMKKKLGFEYRGAAHVGAKVAKLLKKVILANLAPPGFSPFYSKLNFFFTYIE